ncbi:U-box domain-containing protein 35-like isoform X2 [Canna indica]|uniref:RING-type E3 ubiquitin transferase n=1 Tax=Canna indica TaxID=4628 RepID=A0AAQ3QBH2_9LILI|nr:U-box domain-containing protein 35-like isoform X2 [Canna indica]
MSLNATEGNGRASASTLVAIDKDRNSHQAVKWAVDHLLLHKYAVVLIHVKTCKTNPEAMTETMREQMNDEMAQLFLPFRGFCARKGVEISEVVLEDSDVSKALVDYIAKNNIQHIVLGASNRNALTKKFRNPDVPTNIIKQAPEFCAVYVISKGKPISTRMAKSSLPTQPFVSASSRFPDSNDSIKTPIARMGHRGSIAPPTAERNMDNVRQLSRERPLPAARSAHGALYESVDSSHRPPRPSGFPDSFSDDMDFPGTSGFQTMDFGTLDNSSTSSDSPNGTPSPTSGAKELHQWKLEEARRVEEARYAEEAALALAEMEKAKCKAAMEIAEAAQRIAEQEGMKRRNAEMKAKQEAEEKLKALSALAKNDVRYRRYSIEEVEVSTNYFASNLKIGEGGYGPVYRACLDHTAVAIKI